MKGSRQSIKPLVDLSVVVPIYNEDSSIEEMYGQIQSVLDALELSNGWELVLVDDGSTDSTKVILDRLSKVDSRVKATSHTKRRGQSAALTTGFTHSRGRSLVTVDGDLQYDVSEIPKLLLALRKQSFDVVCGRRDNRKDSFSRRAVSYLSYVVRRIILGDDIRDAGCTFRAYGTSSTKWLRSYSLPDGHHRFLPYLLARQGFTLEEVPVEHRPRTHGSSKYSTYGRLGVALRDIIRIRFGLD